MQAFSDFLRNMILGQTIGVGAYVVPHVIKVTQEDETTTYTVTVNEVVHEYEATGGDTEVEILNGLKATLDGSTMPIEADRFVDADDVEALRVRQDGTHQNYVLSVNTAGAGELSVAQQVYATLFTGNPATYGLGGEVNEDGYERPLASFDAVSGGIVESDQDLVFGPAEEDWGTVTHAGLADQSENGNLLYFGELGDSRDILENDKVELLAGNLKITIN